MADIALPKSVFGEKVENHELLKLAYNAYLANGRTNNATTKDRSEVRGGGKKPWKQKGTGRARHGSIRSPIWRGGGITFGPDGSENYSKILNKKSRAKALRQALSLSAKDKAVSTITKFDIKDGKTKEMIKLLEKNNAKGRILAVTANNDPLIARSAANIPRMDLVRPKQLTVYHILNSDIVIFDKDAVTEVEAWLGGVK